MRPLLLATALLLPLLAGCLGAGADADGDGLDEQAERTPRDLALVTSAGVVHRQVTSDPARADTDGDGLSDGEEAEALSDPQDVDSDGDGLLDGHDLLLAANDTRVALLVPRGIVQAPDGRFLGEADAGSRPFEWDSDRPLPDGLGDGDEARGWNVSTPARGTYRVTSSPLGPDTDGDHLNDLEELRRGCDPRLADTDQDATPDSADADCAHDLRLNVTVTRIRLLHDMDPAGDTDLLLQAQAAGQTRTHRQPLRAGDNNVTFAWNLDVQDQGPWQRLRTPLVLAFWDEDLTGDDPQSGVQRQALRLTDACSTQECNVLAFDLDMFSRHWIVNGGPDGVGPTTLEGPDGSVSFLLQPLLG
jgi:hypothetical protein